MKRLLTIISIIFTSSLSLAADKFSKSSEIASELDKKLMRRLILAGEVQLATLADKDIQLEDYLSSSKSFWY